MNITTHPSSIQHSGDAYAAFLGLVWPVVYAKLILASVSEILIVTHTDCGAVVFQCVAHDSVGFSQQEVVF